MILRRSVVLLGAASALIAHLALPTGSVGAEDDPGSQQSDFWRVSYILRPSLEDGALDITAVLMGDVGGGVVWRHADQGMRRAVQSRPEAEDGFGQPLRVASHPQGWTITGGSGGGMRLSYRVTAPGPDPVGAAGVGIGSESIYAPGYELFLTPDPTLTVGSGSSSSGSGHALSVRTEIVFDIPISWRIVVPWEGFGRNYRPENAATLWNSIVAIGDFRRHSVRAAGIDLVVGIQGRDPSRDASVIEAMRRVLTSGQQVFGMLPATSLTVILPRVAPDGEPSLRLGRSLSMGWSSRGALPSDVSEVHRLATELLQMWQSRIQGPGWYREGTTDYLAWLVLLRQNLIQRDVFRRQILRAEQGYLAHPYAADWSFAQEEARSVAARHTTPGSAESGETPGSEEAPDIHSTASLARSRGVVVSVVLDATLARLTNGRRRLTDLMRIVYRWSGQEAGMGGGVADLMAACAAITDGDYLDTFFQALVYGTDRPPTVEALSDILERERGG